MVLVSLQESRWWLACSAAPTRKFEAENPVSLERNFGLRAGYNVATSQEQENVKKIPLNFISIIFVSIYTRQLLRRGFSWL
jgi:hypothetical protein